MPKPISAVFERDVETYDGRVRVLLACGGRVVGASLESPHVDLIAIRPPLAPADEQPIGEEPRNSGINLPKDFELACPQFKTLKL